MTTDTAPAPASPPDGAPIAPVTVEVLTRIMELAATRDFGAVKTRAEALAALKAFLAEAQSTIGPSVRTLPTTGNSAPVSFQQRSEVAEALSFSIRAARKAPRKMDPCEAGFYDGLGAIAAGAILGAAGGPGGIALGMTVGFGQSVLAMWTGGCI